MSPELLNDLEVLSPELWLVATIVLALLADVVWRERGHTAIALLTLVGTGLGLAAIGPAPQGSERVFGLLLDDGHAHFFRALILGGTFVTALFASVFRGLEHETRNEFYPMLLSAALGACLLVATDHLLMLVLGMEMLSLSSYVMAGWQKRERRSAEAAMKYLVYGALSTGLMLFGFSLLYGVAGSLRMSEIGAAVGATFAGAGADAGAIEDGVVLVLATVFALAGLGYKVAIFPFHFWAPDVYEGSPTPVTTFLAVASKAAGFGVLVRFVDGVFLGQAGNEAWIATLGSVFAVLAAVTMTYGNVTAVLQRNVKRLLAYSSIAHAGYLLMGVAVMLASPDGRHAHAGADALLVYMATYYLATLGAFGCVMALANRYGAEDLEDYAGLGWSSPWIGAAIVVFLASLTGLPPTIGFVGKWRLFEVSLDAGLAWLAVVAAINAVVSLFYYFRVVRAMFLSGEAAELEASPAPGLMPRVASLALGVIALVTFALWWWRFDHLSAWVQGAGL